MKREASSMKTDNKSIYDLLKKDHTEVKQLFKQILDECKPDEAAYNQIRSALQVHMRGEEEYFYPAIKDGRDARILSNEAMVEHNSAKMLMDEIDNTGEDDEMWLPRVKVLSEMIDHHVEDEEGDLFDEAKKLLNENQACEIGQKFQEIKGMSAKMM
ncbi:MAG TPA: hemerythrin domain-containing protein [Candidatus Sulfotelmatobacter sp.]|nr:hemerythrin domain-containing protein [Candidatus Sulfotelmatobacter sp.]